MTLALERFCVIHARILNPRTWEYHRGLIFQAVTGTVYVRHSTD